MIGAGRLVGSEHLRQKYDLVLSERNSFRSCLFLLIGCMIWGSSSSRQPPDNLLKASPAMGGDASVVLVVEDEWLLRDCAVAHLRAAGWRTLEAHSGEAAVSLLGAGQQVDILFTDIQLAGAMSGWDLGAQFRKRLPEIPVIYTSGNGSASRCAVPKSLFIAKPYEPEAIIEACRTLVREGQRSC